LITGRRSRWVEPRTGGEGLQNVASRVVVRRDVGFAVGPVRVRAGDHLLAVRVLLAVVGAAFAGRVAPAGLDKKLIAVQGADRTVIRIELRTLR
jgi:hypothetical protein